MQDQTFIDWLVMAQRHETGDLPAVHGDVRIRGGRFDQVREDSGNVVALVDCGDAVRYSVSSLKHEGSHSTACLVKCHNGRDVEISGNVGRVDRPDNVWNHDYADTVAKASALVAGYGLPAFTAGTVTPRASLSERDWQSVKSLQELHGLASLEARHLDAGVPDCDPRAGLVNDYSGAVNRELHVTRNYLAGSEAVAIEAMRHFSSQRMARLSKSRYGSETLVFGSQHGKLHKRLVVYRKAAEMLAHARGPEAKAAVRASAEYQFAHENGLIRVECKWGSDFLREHGLRYMGATDMGKVISIFERETGFLLDASPDRCVRLVQDMPPKVRAAALLWLQGIDLGAIYPRRTLYRHVKALRDYGIDASERRNGGAGSEDELQALLDALPRFELRPAPVPDWYGLPEIARAA